MDPQDMVILVAAIFQGHRAGWSQKDCVREAKEFIRIAEKMLLDDRAETRQAVADAAAERSRQAIEDAQTLLGGR